MIKSLNIGKPAWRRVAEEAAVVVVAAVLTWLTTLTVEFGQTTPLVVAVAAILLRYLREWQGGRSGH